MSEYINRDDALNCFHDWVDEHGDVFCAAARLKMEVEHE